MSTLECVFIGLWGGILQLANIYCPVCGEKNNCMAGTAEPGNCWCNHEGGFPKGIHNLVPPESGGKHCICKKCVDKYREEHEVSIKS